MSVELKERQKVSRDEVARRALAEIKKANKEGLLTAEDTVSTAAHPDHPLHREFEWDDTEAAHKYRLVQARCLIRRIVVTGPNEDESPLPKYISLRADRQRQGGGYRETREVVNSKDLLAQLEDTCKKDIDGVLARYEMLGNLCKKVRKAAGIEGKKKPRS